MYLSQLNTVIILIIILILPLLHSNRGSSTFRANVLESRIRSSCWKLFDGISGLKLKTVLICTDPCLCHFEQSKSKYIILHHHENQENQSSTQISPNTLSFCNSRVKTICDSLALKKTGLLRVLKNANPALRRLPQLKIRSSVV